MTQSNEQKSSNVLMVFGQTGNGKSTLIKLFCGDNAPSSIIGHSTESKTKGTSFFNETSNDELKRMWVDTMGTSDSTDDISNEDILRKIMAKMYLKYESGFNVKVIWVIKKDCRANKELKIEAKFINSLSQYSSSSIWDSAIIIVREGEYKAKSNAKGALAAAAEYYDKTTVDRKNNTLALIDCVGYTMISVLDGDSPVKERIDDGDLDDKTRIMFGYLYDNEIKKEVDSLLNQKNFIKISFKKDICLKCGIEGDPRFVPTKCHKQFERKHGVSLDDDDSDDEYKIEFIHTGEKKWRHKEGETLLQKHTENVVYKSHKSQDTHQDYVGTEIGGWNTRLLCPKCHHEVEDKPVDSLEYCCNCNQKSFYSRVCEKCNSRKLLSITLFQIHYCYSCCFKEKTPITRKLYRKVHSCCNAVHPSLNYCKPEWSCCEKDVNHPGCTKIWSSCQKNEDSEGCEEYWTCCNQPVKTGRPCKYACCKQDRDSRGCKKFCKQCSKPFGTGPGCSSEGVKHRFKKN